MSNEGGRDARKDPASVFQAPAPQVCTTAPEGRLETLWPMDLGEFVVGSDHETTIQAPRNLNELPATGDVIVDAGLGVAGAITASWENPRYDRGKQAGPLRFAFKPQRSGIHTAAVHITVRWDDGHIEHRTAQVTARARAIDAAPSTGGRESAPTSKANASKPQGSKEPHKDRNQTINEDSAREKVSEAHQLVMREQQQGIDDVSREAAKYKPPPAPISIWDVLAEFAILAGTSHLAAFVSRFVADRVAKVLVKADVAERAAKAVDMQAQRADRVARDAAEGPIIPSPTITAESQQAQQARALEKFTSDGIASGVARVLNNNAAKLATDSDSAEQEVAEDGAPSKDKEIAFFSAQRSMHNVLWHDSAAELIDFVGEVLKANPETGKGVVESMAAGIREAQYKGHAKKVQADATSAEFATYLARAKLGTQTLDTDSGKQTVTNLDTQRKHEKLETPELAAGILEIQVSRDATSGAVSVTGARMNGMSHLTASRLEGLDLRSTGVPLRISVHHGATTITVDEANRVRVGGAPLNFRGPNVGSEAQDIHEAERIAHAALAKTLKAWGVAIVTNDQSQSRRAQRKDGQR